MVKNLHFIWYQGESRIPAELQETRARWKELNPGYNVIFWDSEDLEDFIAAEHPGWLIFYRSLGRGEPENVRMIKRCDFARLLVIQTYGGWYVDMDCIPLRPLETLLGPSVVAHRMTPKAAWLKGPGKPLKVDFESYQLVLTREVYPLRETNGFTVCNGIMYAQPGAEVLAGYIASRRPLKKKRVLDFAGPHAFSRYLRENMEDVRGKVLVLPPWYFLWQVQDMGPPWKNTVCIHQNRLDWADRSRAQPWDI